jgi:hypothetical protein
VEQGNTAYGGSVMRKYYTLAIREDGVWTPQFGDYNRSVVEEERSYVVGHPSGEVKKKDTKVICSGSSQASINAAIAKLNERN